VIAHRIYYFLLGSSIVIAYLMRYMNMTLRDAYLLCKQRRPICFPNLGFWNQLIAYEYQLKKDNSVKSRYLINENE
jgi:protein-tyrosine phosphatase